MTTRVVLAPRALRQAEAAATWWVHHRADARGLFAEEFAATLRLLAEHPTLAFISGKLVVERFEGFYFWRTEYHLYYVHQVSKQLVRVLAVWAAVRGRTPSL